MTLLQPETAEAIRATFWIYYLLIQLRFANVKLENAILITMTTVILAEQ